MTTVWGIHNVEESIDFIALGEIAVGWDDLGDLTSIGNDRTALREALARTHPDAKPGALPVWAGMLHRFVHVMERGDYIVYPNKFDGTIAIGQVSGPYRFETTAAMLKNRRSVEWIVSGIPRAEFSTQALYEVGSALTLFAVKTHKAEFLSAAAVAASTPDGNDTDEETADAELTPTAERVEQSARDFIVNTLKSKLTSYEFEQFTGSLLEAMGYQTRMTPPSGDGGVDVLAFRDALGLEPPLIKVQCKQIVATISAPDVQKLLGTLSHSGREAALFVTLGPFTRDAISLERTFSNLRLVSGDDLAQLVMDHYDDLPAHWRRMLPLRRTWVVDADVA